MMHRQVIVIAALVASLSASAAWAQDRCDYGDFTEQAVTDGAAFYGVVAPRAYFYEDYPQGCPGDKPACRRKAYLIAKNKVLVGTVRNGWACAWYEGAKSTVGWLRMADLAKVARAAKPLGWLGDWTTGDSSISITRAKDGGLVVSADTTNMALPSTPSGGFKGDLMVDGPTGVYTDYDAAARDKAQFPNDPPGPHCVVKFRRVDRYLIASDDNGYCGALGTTLTGVYTR
jgi:hypothetical protein